ncbi:hypothetical protein HGRIS_004808 [Hohenbuehelia grisea]|uniref:Glucose-methanol-choline oxidoreductase C-terminal domain-containing protein n=1 Tax=Hohenbuehelia grisea TaxID=104357 RepID=A0ABR3JD17_9AGAR
MGTPYFASQDVNPYDLLVQGDSDEWKKQTDRWNRDGKGLLGSNGLDAALKIRPHLHELEELGPDFAKRWESYFARYPDKPIAWISCSPRVPVDDLAKTLGVDASTKFISGSYYLMYPSSTGSIHASSDDVYAPLDFDTGFLKELADLATLRWAFKKSLEIVRRLPCFRGVIPSMQPSFPEGSAALIKETKPVDIAAPKLIFTEEDDAAIDEYHRKSVRTNWHSLGTCAMRPREQGGVVDHRLNVYGVQRLKITDLSIAPDNVNAVRHPDFQSCRFDSGSKLKHFQNTYSTAIAIGEKAAVLIAEELGIDLA